MKRYNYIFWDFDGTIVNTVEGTRQLDVISEYLGDRIY